MSRAALSVVLVMLGCSGGCSGEPEPVGETVTATPLPARTTVAGTRFSRLDPAATGLAFRNELRRENTVAYVYMGAGLTVGDYDGDGLPDVYLVSQDGANKLFRQTAPLRFEDVTATAGAGLDGGDAWGTAATFADVDGDGDLDLYVCNLESPNLLFVNNGDGTFVEKAGMFGLGATYASTGAAFADYDNDGDLDLYLLTNRVFRPTLARQIVQETTPPAAIKKDKNALLAPELTFEFGGRTFMAGQQDRLFRNDGYASFVDVTDEAGLQDHGNGLSVVWWDFDDDGYQDLYVANDFQSPDLMWRNRGDGTFEDVTERLPHTAFFGMGCDFADLDRDGRMDLCVADMSSTTHYMGKMLMGHMDQHRWFLMNSDPQQYMRNALYVNTGAGPFLECAHMAGLASTDWTWTVRFADLDEDGLPDFYATNGIPVFADNPDIGDRVKALWEQRRYNAALDVMRNMPRVDEKNIARRNLGDLQFEDVGAAWGLDESGVTHGAVVVDLDRDGDLDIVTNNLNAEASVFENRTADTHRLLVELRGADGNTFGVGAKIEVDVGGTTHVRQVSLTRGYMSAGEAVEHLGLGGDAKVVELRVTWPSGRVQRVADVPVDHHLVIREDVRIEPARPQPKKVVADVPEEDPAAKHVERDFDDFAAQPLLPHRLSRLGPGAAAANLGGDGDAVWFGGAAGQAGTLFSGYDVAAGRWREPIEGPWRDDAACEDMGAVFVDFDGDGDLDLFVASGGVEADEGDAALRDRLYVNDGDGTFSRAPDGVLPDLRVSSSCVVAADYDRDGDVDLFVGGRVIPGRYPYAPPSVLLRNDGGRFVDATDEVAPVCRALGMVASACWTDLDDDGFVDLVVAAQWQPVRVLRNDGGKKLVDHTAALGIDGVRGQWNGVTSADVDGDGDLDLVVTNLGLNTKYHASPDKPIEIYARDFDGNGTVDVVEAKHSGDKTLPVRGLSCSSQAMPFVREKFPTFDQFAKATLGEIYGDALDESLALSCNELRHMWFENDGGRLTARPLPRRAQISTGFGVLATQRAPGELMVAHNFYSPEPETGRTDGGLGAVVSLSGATPQVDILAARRGDHRGLLRFDGGGASLIGHVRNDDVHGVQVLDGEVAPLLWVRLLGPAGNPAAVGARLTFKAEGRVAQVREIAAGDGYLTQSTPVVAVPRDRWTCTVRWPDGQESTHELTGDQAQATLRR
ncbi:MAG: VCBS repeat-containing protein [Planctomycetes bacterium]|nr:VCBS repeat-containing protein [Planctomycetota bacterium]